MANRFAKRAIALALAATTAFTFAPMTGLYQTSIVAEAADVNTSGKQIAISAVNNGATIDINDQAVASHGIAGTQTLDVYAADSENADHFDDGATATNYKTGNKIVISVTRDNDDSLKDITVNVAKEVDPGVYYGVIKADTKYFKLTVTGTASKSMTGAKISETANTSGDGGILKDTFKTADDQDIIYIKKGKSVTLRVDLPDVISATEKYTPVVTKKPAGLSVAAGDIVANKKVCLVTIAADDAVKCDLNGVGNVWVQFNDKFLKLYVSSDSFTQEISAKKTSFDLNSGETKSIADMLAVDKVELDAATIDGVAGNDTTFTISDELYNNVNLKDSGSTTKDYTDIPLAANAANYTMEVKANAVSGTKAKVTITNPKDTSTFKFDGTKITIEKATFDFTVNLVNKASSEVEDIVVGSDNGDDIPFKALVSMSTDVNAQEVADSDGTALSKSTGRIKIDNSAKTITLTKGETGVAYVKFVPKNTSINGDGVVIKMTLVTGSSVKDATIITASAKSGVLEKSGDSFTITPAGGAGYNSANDIVTFNFENDSIKNLFTVTHDGTYSAKAGVYTIAAKDGVPAGTYKAYLSTYDGDGSKVLKFAEFSVVMAGASKDDPDYIGFGDKNKTNHLVTWSELTAQKDAIIDKIIALTKNAKMDDGVANRPAGMNMDNDAQDRADVWNFVQSEKGELYSTDAGKGINLVWSATDSVSDADLNGTANDKAVYTAATGTVVTTAIKNLYKDYKEDLEGYKYQVILSGTETRFTITSPIADAGIVSDIELGSLYAENASTGARMSEGFTKDGMDVVIDATKLEVGKAYYIYVTTKGTGINESDSMIKTTQGDNIADALCVYVQAGYNYNYNYGEFATIKAGKKIENVSISADQDAKVTLEDGSNLECVGATFLGWAFTEDAKKADIPSIDAKDGLNATEIKNSLDHQVAGEIQLYAVWDFNNYTVTYDANGGSGSADNRTFTVSAKDVVLPTTGFANGLKPLVGWSTTATAKTTGGGSLPVYAANGTALGAQQLQALIKEVDETGKTTAIKLYAQYGAALKSVSITPETLSLEVGKTGKLTASAINEEGNVAAGAAITFTSDNPDVASVDAEGNVTANAKGTANITATAKLGAAEITSTASVVTVTAAKKAATFKQSTKKIKLKTVAKKAQKVTITVKGSKGAIKATNASAKKIKKFATVKVSKRKVVVTLKKGAKKGTYKVKVVVAAKGNYKKTTKTFKIIVK